MEAREEEFFTSRRVGIGVLAALVGQLLAGGYFVGKMDARISAVETTRYTSADGAALEAKVEANESNIDALESRTVGSLNEIKLLLREIQRELNAR